MADDNQESRNIRIIVFTSFFKREKKLYAMGDIAFPKPIPFKLLGFIILGLVVWTLPIIQLFGGNFMIIFKGPAYAVGIIGPAIGIGFMLSRPCAIFNNKTFFKYAICQIKFLINPKNWCDLHTPTVTDKSHVDAEHTIWLADSALNKKKKAKNVGKISSYDKQLSVKIS